MRKTSKFILISLILIIFYGCGYSVLDKSLNYKIIDISLEGEKKINYNIKNKLLFYNGEDNDNKLNLRITTSKKKIIKNKSVKNEITSYQIEISTTVSYKLIGDIKENNFTISRSGDYKVSSNRVISLNSEKRLIETLTNNIIEKISQKLNNIINDN